MTKEKQSRFWQFIDNNWKNVVRITFIVLSIIIGLAIYAIITQM